MLALDRQLIYRFRSSYFIQDIFVWHLFSQWTFCTRYLIKPPFNPLLNNDFHTTSILIKQTSGLEPRFLNSEFRLDHQRKKAPVHTPWDVWFVLVKECPGWEKIPLNDKNIYPTYTWALTNQNCISDFYSFVHRNIVKYVFESSGFWDSSFKPPRRAGPV